MQPQAVELAVSDMCNLAQHGYTSNQRSSLCAIVAEVKHYFELRTFQALADAISSCVNGFRFVRMI